MTKRASGWLFGATMLAGGGVAILIGATQWGAMTGAAGRGAPVVALSPRLVPGVPIGLALVLIAVLGVLPGEPAAPSRRRRAAARRVDGPMLVLIAAAALFVIGLLTVPFASTMADAALGRRGYRPCPPLTWERPVQERWALPPLSRCPTTPREARALTG